VQFLHGRKLEKERELLWWGKANNKEQGYVILASKVRAIHQVR